MSFRYRVATVFGGSGFIGRHLIKRLAKTGTIIRVATRHPSNANFLRTNGAVGQIIPIATNINDDASVAAAVRDADIVINLIGILYESGVNTFRGTQGDAPGRIARAAKAAGAQRAEPIRLGRLRRSIQLLYDDVPEADMGWRAVLDDIAAARKDPLGRYFELNALIRDEERIAGDATLAGA